MLEIDKAKAENIKDIHWQWFSHRAQEKTSWDSRYTYEQYIEDFLDISSDDLKDLIIGEKNLWTNLPPITSRRKPRMTKNKSKITYDEEISKWEMENLLYTRLTEAFGYDDFCKEDNKEPWYQNFKKQSNRDWNAYELFKELNINVCPYCGRQYIYTLYGSEKYRTDIDHFFPQSKYPYLTCSLFNFIPSCKICNTLKRDSYEEFDEVVYPYDESFGKNGVFRASYHGQDVENVDYCANIKEVQIYLKISGDLSNKITKSNSIFHLEQFYNEHKIEIQDLFERYKWYTKPKMCDILKFILTPEQTEMLPEEEINNLLEEYATNLKDCILGIPLKNESEYPLKKFKLDLIEQLDDARNS